MLNNLSSELHDCHCKWHPKFALAWSTYASTEVWLKCYLRGEEGLIKIFHCLKMMSISIDFPCHPPPNILNGVQVGRTHWMVQNNHVIRQEKVLCSGVWWFRNDTSLVTIGYCHLQNVPISNDAITANILGTCLLQYIFNLVRCFWMSNVSIYFPFSAWGNIPKTLMGDKTCGNGMYRCWFDVADST